MGEQVWEAWIERYDADNKIKVNNVSRDFRFGGGEVLRSDYEVSFTAVVK